MSREARVHLDAHHAASAVSASLCGQLAVPVTDDVSRATCKVCLTRFKRGTATEPLPLRHAIGEQAFADAMHIALRALPTATPYADAPPQITPLLWATSCKGAVDGRCRDCELCAWQSSADLYQGVRPWTEGGTEGRDPNAARTARWSSVSGALLALARYQQTGGGRLKSALGSMLERARLKLGSQRDTTDGSTRAHAYDDVVHVLQALESAYGEGHGGLDAADCIAVLYARTPGAGENVVSYEALGKRFAVTEGALKGIVKHGRAVVFEELTRRGLLAMDRMRPPTPQISSMRVADIEAVPT